MLKRLLALCMLWLSLSCRSTPRAVSPPAPLDAAPALDAQVRPDAAVSEDARPEPTLDAAPEPPPRSLRAWVASCANPDSPWTDARLQGADEALAQDQRERHFEGLGTVRTHLALVRGPRGRLLGLLAAGLQSDGGEGNRCALLSWFAAGRSAEFYRGPLAQVGGPALDAVATLYRSDGPYAGTLLLAVRDAQGRLVHARFFNAATLLAPDSFALFPDGRALRVYTLDDGMNYEGTATAHLIALTSTGLRDLETYPAGHFAIEPCWMRNGAPQPAVGTGPLCRSIPAERLTMVTPGERPRLRITRQLGRRTLAHELLFDPAQLRFVLAGRETAVPAPDAGAVP